MEMPGFNPDQDPVFEGVVDSADAATAAYLGEHLFEVVVYFSVVVVLAGILAWIMHDWQFLILGLVVLFLSYRYVYNKAERAFMKQFAKLNNFDFANIGSLQGKDGFIFKEGHDQKVYDVLEGKFQNYPIQLFNFSYVTGYGKNRQVHRRTIFQVDFQTPVPQILLRPKGLLVFLDHGFSEDEAMKLEGDFNQHFDLYTKKGYEVETLQVFTPDIMSKFETDWKGYPVELISTKLYVYANKEISTKTELQNLFEISKALIQNLAPVLERMKSDVAAMAAVQR